MTKQDFILIADALRALKPQDEKADLSHWQLMLLEFAERLENKYPRFNRDTFMQYIRGTK